MKISLSARYTWKLKSLKAFFVYSLTPPSSPKYPLPPPPTCLLHFLLTWEGDGDGEGLCVCLARGPEEGDVAAVVSRLPGPQVQHEGRDRRAPRVTGVNHARGERARRKARLRAEISRRHHLLDKSITATISNASVRRFSLGLRPPPRTSITTIISSVDF